MRISDWSSDVCSSDLRACARTRTAGDDDEIIPGVFSAHGSAVQLVLDRLGGSESQFLRRRDLDRLTIGGIAAFARGAVLDQIGRSSCRERVCQYVSISVGAAAFKKKK